MLIVNSSSPFLLVKHNFSSHFLWLINKHYLSLILNLNESYRSNLKSVSEFRESK